MLKDNIEPIALIDLYPSTTQFKEEVLNGLSLRQKRISPQHFYDKRGSELFERICGLPEYYLTRTEFGILEQNLENILSQLSLPFTLIEFGSGSSKKTKLLLSRLNEGSTYVPVDICREALIHSSQELRQQFPNLTVVPICADFKFPTLLSPYVPAGNRVVFFPGSTFGNLEPKEASEFLSRVREFLGVGGMFIIGIDLLKDAQVLECAYNDSQGVTADFNLNLLTRMSTELGISVDPSNFKHQALFNKEEGRIEMHIVSRCKQTLLFAGHAFDFQEGERIFTESSYKYDDNRFEKMAHRAGFQVAKLWTDPKRYFGLYLLSSVGQ
jgi:dimethylhistidine N-methyltransferase